MKINKYSLIFCAFALSVSVIASISTAQDTQQETASEPVTADAQSNTPKPEGDFEVFKPKEEISEDLSVPFPVDI